VTDLAIAVALGGDAACDVAVLRAQPACSGGVASDPTVSRLITRLAGDTDDALATIAAGSAAARERVWSDTPGSALIVAGLLHAACARRRDVAPARQVTFSASRCVPMRSVPTIAGKWRNDVAEHRQSALHEVGR
jgi:hypothetical protein